MAAYVALCGVYALWAILGWFVLAYGGATYRALGAAAEPSFFAAYFVVR